MADESEVVLIEDELAAVASDVAVIGAAADDLPAGATRLPGGAVRLVLAYPVELKFRRPGSDEVRIEPVTEMTFNRLTGADMRAISSASQDAQVVVAIARSTRISEGKMGPIYDRMDGADVAAAAQIVSDFLGTGRKTGR